MNELTFDEMMWWYYYEELRRRYIMEDLWQQQRF